MLSSCDHFTDEDIATIYKVGTYDAFYGKKQEENQQNLSSYEGEFNGRADSIDSGFGAGSGADSRLRDLELAKFESTQTKDPALQKSVAELDQKLALLEQRLEKMSELFV